jgi:uncharacterized protein (DUF362 family)
VPDPATIVTTLAESAHPAGGWGYAPGQPLHIEPTCFALLALAAEPTHAEVCQRAWTALAGLAQADGSYRVARGRPQALWPTARVLFTRAALGQPPNHWQTQVDFLRRVRGRPVARDPELDSALDIDTRLLGWAWSEANFSWVEPTAWAILALRKAQHGNDVAVREGLRLLLDRAFDDGGINYGNRIVLGKATDPIPTNSALFLLATQGAPDHPRLTATRTYLRERAPHADDLEHLAWAVLAFDTQPEAAATAAEFRTRLRAAYSACTHTIGTVRLALSALALGEPNPFRLTDTPTVAAGPASTELPPAPAKPPLLERWATAIRGAYVAGMNALRPLPTTSAVHIAAAPTYASDLVSILRAQYAGFRAHVALAGQRVVLKPNLVEYHPDKVINTDPRFVGAVIDFCRAEGAASVTVAEGPGHWRNVEFLVNESGLGAVLRARNVPFVDLNHDEVVKTMNLGRTTGLEYLYLTQTVTSADVLISLPKLKMHHWAGATLSLKNLFGTLPGICYGWPKNELHWRGISQSIVDIALTTLTPVLPHLAIIDGIVGMEGDGPLNGVARPAGVVVMGADYVAVDATGCRLMGLDPRRVVHLRLGEQKRLGRLNEAEIPQLGVSIANKAQSFALPPQIDKLLLAAE